MDPVAVGGTLTVMLVLVVMAVMVVGYRTVPEPFVVKAFADPPMVSDTWNVPPVALTT